MGYSSSPIPIDVSSTSGLPVNLKVISGPATASGNTITPTGVGSVTLQADQAGDANYLPAANEEKKLRIAPAPVTVSLSASSTNVIYPQTVSLDVAVLSNGTDGVPGTVTLNDGGEQLGTVSLDANGTAAFNNVQLAIGNHPLSAAFNASNGNHLPAVSPTVNISVVAPTVTPRITITPSSASVSTGQTLSVSVVLSGGGSNPKPTGTITLSGGGYGPQSATLSGGSASFSIPANTLNVGTDTLIASYSPDTSSSSTYNSATGMATVTVTQPPNTPTLTVTPSASNITTAQALTVTITVGGAGGNPTPTGEVTLTSGVYSSLATRLNGGCATISIPAGALSTGNDTLTVVYLGDSNYGTATGTASISVNPSPSFTLSASPANISIAQGGSGTSIITVGTVGSFSGNVSLSASGMPSGVTASFAPGSATGSQTLTLTVGISAQITSSPLTVTVTGTSDSLTATTSIALTITAEPSFTAGSGGTTSMTLAHGATTGNAGTISVVGTNGFSGTVNLTCKATTLMTNVNDMPTCSLSPLSVNIQGATAQTSTLTVNTTAATSANNQLKKVIWPSAGGATLALLLFFTLPKRRDWLGMLGVLVLFVSVGTLGCGGGGSRQGGGGSGNSGTTVGSYTITVTGTSDALSVTVGTVTLTVQ